MIHSELYFFITIDIQITPFFQILVKFRQIAKKKCKIHIKNFGVENTFRATASNSLPGTLAPTWNSASPLELILPLEPCDNQESPINLGKKKSKSPLELFQKIYPPGTKLRRAGSHPVH